MKKAYISPTADIFVDELPVLLSSSSREVNNEFSIEDQEAKGRANEEAEREENAWESGSLW